MLPSEYYKLVEYDVEDLCKIFEITHQEMIHMILAVYPDKVPEHIWKVMGENENS